jgi:hypothetical protein
MAHNRQAESFEYGVVNIAGTGGEQFDMIRHGNSFMAVREMLAGKWSPEEALKS